MRLANWATPEGYSGMLYVPGFEPLPVLTPTPEECNTDWWRASCHRC
ncbi:hypothetical protein Hanom_Chr17g01525171 [Helianthus anomalus]